MRTIGLNKPKFAFFILPALLPAFRWKSGVASSLNYVKITDEESPTLIPYPSWEANTIESDSSSAPETTGGRLNAPKAAHVDGGLADNSSIISTFRIRVDECDRLWVMDTGLADILGSPKQIAPPALVIFDLKTDKLIRRYAFKESDIKSDTFFANVVSARTLRGNFESSCIRRERHLTQKTCSIQCHTDR